MFGLHKFYIVKLRESFSEDSSLEEYPRNVDYLISVFSGSSMDLLTTVSSILSTVPNLCTPTSSLLCLPTVMFLSSATFKYISMNVHEDFQEKHELKTALAKLCKSFKTIITCTHVTCEESKDGWNKMIQR